MIRLGIDGLPPSSNHAYFNLPRGGRALTKEGKNFKRETTSHLAQNYRVELAKITNEHPYLLHVVFHMPNLENKGYPNTAENRYKKLDADNRLKLLQDCLSDACGIDDSQILTVILQKKPSKEEKTEIFLWDLDEEPTPFDEGLW